MTQPTEAGAHGLAHPAPHPYRGAVSDLSMKQLAEIAGLDISTVSRALRGDSSRVAAGTIERVKKLAMETGYTLDPAASALRSKRSRLIGVVVHTLTDIVMGQLATAIDQTAREAGYLSMVVATQEDPEARSEAVRSLKARRVDGLILCESELGREVPAELVDSTMPFIFAMRGCDGRPSVTADDLQGGRLVAEHFSATGRRHVALIPGPERARTAAERAEGFSRAAVDAGLTLTVAPGPGGFGAEEGRQMTELLLKRRPRPGAIFCTNDHTAIGAIRALTDAGLAIGSDVAVAGYNDLSMSPFLQTPLTSVRTDIPSIGREAVLRLLKIIEGQPTTSLKLTPTLCVRESSSPAPKT